jgi:predicted enzyme related to lactoylglutathione lyase
MDAFQTHGAPSWSELTTTDPSAAAEFYGKLLGWTFESMDMAGGTYRVVKVGDTAVAGIMGQPLGAPPMPPAWGTYVTVDNLDECVKRAAELGGKQIVPPSDVPGVGRFAVIQDPQGAVLSLMTYERRTGD